MVSSAVSSSEASRVASMRPCTARSRMARILADTLRSDTTKAISTTDSIMVWIAPSSSMPRAMPMEITATCPVTSRSMAKLRPATPTSTATVTESELISAKGEFTTRKL